MREMKDSGIEWLGNIPTNWAIKRIKNIFDVISGTTPITSNADYWDGDIPWITPADYKTGDKYVTKGRRNISKLGFDSSHSSLIPKGSIIFSKRAPIGTVALNEENLCTNQGCLACIPKTDADCVYFYYLMSIITEQFELLGAGTTFKEISAYNFMNFTIPVPSFTEQHIIADYLDARCAEIDSLTADIKEQIDVLEQYKKSVISEAVTKGLDPDAEMKDSGIKWIGQIPINWNVGRIKYNYYLKGRIGWQGLKADEFIDEGPYLITGTDFDNGRVNWPSCYHISKARYDEAPEIHVKQGDLLITKDGTVGKVAYIDNNPGDASLNSHLLLMRPINLRYCNRFLFYVIQSNVFDKYSIYYQSGSTMASLSQEKVSNFSFPLPGYNEQLKISDYLDAKCAEIDEIISTRQDQLETLSEYKKSLIYEYVTGKKEVPTN